MSNFKANKEAIKILPENKQELARALVAKAEFMDQQLTALQKIIKKNGWVEQYQHGANQSGTKPTTEANVYNTVIKNFNSVIKQINDLIPDKASSVDPVEKEFFN